jgi:hypothetical protein
MLTVLYSRVDYKWGNHIIYMKSVNNLVNSLIKKTI